MIDNDFYRLIKSIQKELKLQNDLELLRLRRETKMFWGKSEAFREIVKNREIKKEDLK